MLAWKRFAPAAGLAVHRTLLSGGSVPQVGARLANELVSKFSGRTPKSPPLKSVCNNLPLFCPRPTLQFNCLTDLISLCY
jgi:hypothetical protein